MKQKGPEKIIKTMGTLMSNSFATKLTFVEKTWCGEVFYFSHIQEVSDTP